MKVSNCCSAPFINGYKEDGERCSACKEHCGIEELDFDSLTLEKLLEAYSALTPHDKEPNKWFPELNRNPLSIICFLKGAWNDIWHNAPFHIMGHSYREQEDRTLKCEVCGLHDNVKTNYE